MIDRLLGVLTSQFVRIRGESMWPALPDRKWVRVTRRAYSHRRKPERFDVIRFEDPSERGHWVVKRIVGLPDEELRLEDGRLFIDGIEIDDPRARGASGGKSEWWPCTNEYVVLGDNRDASTDSRKFGAVPIGKILGRVRRGTD